MAGRVLDFVTLGTLLSAAVFAVVALNVDWSKGDFGVNDVGLRPLTVRSADDGNVLITPYSSDSLDDLDGIGMARSGGVLFLIGALVVGLGALLAEHRVVLGKGWTLWSTAVAGGIGAVLMTIGVVLLPIGMTEIVQDGNGTAGTISWRFGLFAGIIAAAAALAGTILATVGALRATGFKLELADPATPSFD